MKRKIIRKIKKNINTLKIFIMDIFEVARSGKLSDIVFRINATDVEVINKRN